VVANFNGFLRSMTGPARLRAALRKARLPLFTLLTALNSSASVRKSLPASVLGGDIFGLMSKRLRELLEVTTQSETVVSRSRTSRHPLIDDFTHRESAKTLLTVRYSPAGRLVSSANSDQEQLDHLRRILAESASPGLPAAGDQLFAPSREGAPESIFSLISTPADGNVRLVSEPADLLARYKQNGNAELPLLERKLQQYWKLSQPGRTGYRNPGESSPAGGISQTSVAGFSEPLGLTPASRPWAELVGREISRKARAASNQIHSEASSSMSHRSTGNVEIQNVFNIEVRSGSNGANGFDDLSERITEILNEQALQHGIDVT
jgi:hypothetical protein